MKFSMFKNEITKNIAAVVSSCEINIVIFLQDHCLVKLKWKFGALNIYLKKNQISKWHPLLVAAFNNLHSSYPKQIEQTEVSHSLTQSLNSESRFSIMNAQNGVQVRNFYGFK